MTYDHWKTTPPDDGDEPLPPPTQEEQEAEAWEYWHQRAEMLQAALDCYSKEQEKLRAAMREIEEIAGEAADVDDGIPNRAMRILVIARAHLHRPATIGIAENH